MPQAGRKQLACWVWWVQLPCRKSHWSPPAERSGGRSEFWSMPPGGSLSQLLHTPVKRKEKKGSVNHPPSGIKHPTWKQWPVWGWVAPGAWLSVRGPGWDLLDICRTVLDNCCCLRAGPCTGSCWTAPARSGLSQSARLAWKEWLLSSGSPVKKNMAFRQFLKA